MNEQLFAVANSLTLQDCINNEAEYIYRKIIKHCRRQALFGKMEIELSPFLPQDLQVLSKVMDLLNQQGLKIRNDNRLSWGRTMVTPRLTARHLVEMGYNPAEGDLFKRILDSVRTAIVKGLISNEVIDGQIQWVKEHFSNV